MTFLLGRQAMLGHEPPTYSRSMTAVFIPFLASVQAMYFPASPLPSTRRSYSSGFFLPPFWIPLVLSSSRGTPTFPAPARFGGFSPPLQRLVGFLIIFLL